MALNVTRTCLVLFVIILHAGELIESQEIEYNGLIFANDRFKRESKNPQGNRKSLDGIAGIRNKINLEKLNEAKKKAAQDLMHADANPRMGPNDTAINYQYGEKYRLLQDRIVQNRMQTLRKMINSVPQTDCNFETPCLWKWADNGQQGFYVTSAKDLDNSSVSLQTDANNKVTGHFLFLNVNPNAKPLHITSPVFTPSGDTCKVQLWIYQELMTGGVIRIVAENANKTQWVVEQIPGDDSRRWVKHDYAVGEISSGFNIIIEVVPPPVDFPKGAIVALDNIKVMQCFPETDAINSCTPFQYQCYKTNVCINHTRICDITEDCESGDDESQNCDKVPYGARCDFEADWCGWMNVGAKEIAWKRHNGTTPSNKTGPNKDHTYMNSTGKYMYVNMGVDKAKFATIATLQSTIFNPPPRAHLNVSSNYYKSCMIRFYLHQYGSHKSGIDLSVVEIKPKENVSTQLFWSYNNYGDIWVRKLFVLPNITHRYFLKFEAKRGIRYLGDIAIDDFTMSPECFGLNIPTEELQGYNYWNAEMEYPSVKPHPDFENETYYEITTCGVRGRHGPTSRNCITAYNNTNTSVTVLNDNTFKGVQKWVAPSEGYYTFILVGASGGKGSGGMGSSRAAMVRTVMELYKGQEIYFLVGQEGSNACYKSLGHMGNSSCSKSYNLDGRSKNLTTAIRMIQKMEILDGGGGGGGGTFMYYLNKNNRPVALAVAGGGGGLGLGAFDDKGWQHGQAINMSRLPVTGQMYGPGSAGAGGGWDMFYGEVAYDHQRRMGQAFLRGGVGGEACYNSSDGSGDGGFGGGGGGCTAGGGGGGYAGGNAREKHGEGGFSFINSNRTILSFSEARSGYHAGPGSVLIVPAIPGCECDYRCLALDYSRSKVTCICPTNWKLDSNGKSCLLMDDAPTQYPTWFVSILIVCVICLALAFGVVFFFLYNRYQQRAAGILRQKILSGPDLQLNRLRVASDNMMTEYNPNYSFDGAVYTLKDLKDIPRNHLRLVKALGQGAFGEVYQGFYRQRIGDTVEMPVAVKTLPEMSTHQAEMDFLMEALIMSKFNHPNIVHFIGVCFDKHPRYIVLELLAGGDLKNFLRESRPKPNRGSPLTVKDLVLIAIDVAKGCKYLEDHRFIHRDIAARNCLLTTKGPGRVVKIADFGMSRDIYRSDYYRKGGKAMLPIKWMPPEAFLDGIFTSKTDVWSYGVLLWEIMSMGYMPYTGCPNREVMQLVTSGGRLEPPANCPGPIYGIMTQCWHPAPEQRPTFGLILERLGYCAQDPEVMNASLPIFDRPPSTERDTTLMRPQNSDDNCLQVPQTADYLIPNHTISATQNTGGSTTSMDKLLPENSDNWETSFAIPHSKSTQPLLQESEQNQDESTTPSVNKLLSMDSKENERLSQKMSQIPNNILSNHNNNVKHEQSSISAGVSLDASALAKQQPQSSTVPSQKTSYANVDTMEAVTENGVIPNGSTNFTAQKSYFRSMVPNESVNC
ncbi:ALK tyrosine kinase receptor [Agrilus planipennis]|uniref:Tyrosine-protein kinase receptor n=1 Tax=Agrilus planipennis TaxID=224129 RepID=A0A7F5RA20_AGRPL|nr:ALK tyrosine kinase receptor [Agrilus planipennis]